MLSHIIGASFALFAAGANAMDCMQAAQKFGNFESACPRQCNPDNAEGSLPKCALGRKERSKTSCNTDSCRNFLSSMDYATMEGIMSGLGTCTGQMAGYAAIASLGVDYLNIVMKITSMQCGLDSAFAGTIAPANTCTGAVWLAIMAPDNACPRRCDKEESDDLPTCAPGQSEYDATSCGVPSCGKFIGELDDETLGNLSQGLAACATDPNNATKMYAKYSTNAGDGLKMRVESFAKECNYEDKVRFTPTPMDSCMGAFGVVQQFDRKCPRQCEKDGDNPRRCGDDEPERVESMCGVTGCQDLLAQAKGKGDEMKAGLAKCANVPNMEMYAQYASQLQDYVGGLAWSCGFNYDDLYDKTVPAPPSPAPRPSTGCIGISTKEYKDLFDLGFEAKKCA